MKKIASILYVMALLVPLPLPGEKAAVINEILQPSFIMVDDTQFYITERASILIYSLKDYRFVKKFGREGRGPREFAIPVVAPLIVDVTTGDIIVYSHSKISCFSKSGRFKREKRIKPMGGICYPVKDGWAATGQTRENGVLYNTIDVYDSAFNKIKEIARSKFRDNGKNLEFYMRTFSFRTYDNKIFVASDAGFVIDVFDAAGKKLYSITRNYKRKKFDPEIEKWVRDLWIKTNPAGYEFYKNKMKFPDYFPAIFYLFIDSNKIYVFTRKTENKKIECFVLGLKGNLIRKQYIDVAFRERKSKLFPLTIKNEKLYQLIENDEEIWELHVTYLE